MTAAPADDAMDEPGDGSVDRRRAFEWVLLGVGWAVVVVAALGALGRISHFAGEIPWMQLALWCIGLAAAHDLVVGPAIAGIALLLARLPWVARGAVAAALAVSAIVVGVSFARIRAYGADPGEPSFLAGSAVPDVARVVALVWVVAGVTAVATSIRARRLRPG